LKSLQHGRRQSEPAELFAVADRHDAVVVIDEACDWSARAAGAGLAASFEGRDNAITLHTCGKALGTVGGFILGPRVVRDFLVNRARRSFLNRTLANNCTVIRVALESPDQPVRREQLARLV
jgi:8-amino-7-oxononanoate synthase